MSECICKRDKNCPAHREMGGVEKSILIGIVFLLLGLELWALNADAIRDCKAGMKYKCEQIMWSRGTPESESKP